MKKLIAIAVVGLIAGSMNVANASGKKHCCPPVATKAAKAIPDVTYPFTFKCDHCGMTITVKSKDDWMKSCEQCACGASNLDCYKPKK